MDWIDIDFQKEKKMARGVFALAIYPMINHSSKWVKWFLQTSDPGFFAHRQTDKQTNARTK